MGVCVPGGDHDAVGPDVRSSHFYGVARSDDVEASDFPGAHAWFRERDGRKLEWDGIDVFPFEDGLIKRKDVYSASHAPRVGD